MHRDLKDTFRKTHKYKKVAEGVLDWKISDLGLNRA